MKCIITIRLQKSPFVNSPYRYAISGEDMKILIILVLVIIVFITVVQSSKASLLKAIMQVESSGGTDTRPGANGELGPYQITEAYWHDACEYGGISDAGYRTDAYDEEWCEIIIEWYWKRYCPLAYRLNIKEVMARVHNGGPHGHQRSSTIPYWNRVRRHLK